MNIPERVLPTWRDEWSDGCSILPFLPKFLRVRFNVWLISRNVKWHRIANKICVVRDRLYYYGGSKNERLAVDSIWLVDMIYRAEMSPRSAKVGYRLIRMFGGPGWRRKGVSWAFGGKYFKYSPLPAASYREVRETTFGSQVEKEEG